MKMLIDILGEYMFPEKVSLILVGLLFVMIFCVNVWELKTDAKQDREWLKRWEDDKRERMAKLEALSAALDRIKS